MTFYLHLELLIYLLTCLVFTFLVKLNLCFLVKISTTTYFFLYKTQIVSFVTGNFPRKILLKFILFLYQQTIFFSLSVFEFDPLTKQARAKHNNCNNRRATQLPSYDTKTTVSSESVVSCVRFT